MSEIDQEMLDLAQGSGLRPGRPVMVMEMAEGWNRVWKVPATMTQGEARSYVGLVACSRHVESATLIAESPQRGVRVLDRISYPQG